MGSVEFKLILKDQMHQYRKEQQQNTYDFSKFTSLISVMSAKGQIQQHSLKQVIDNVRNTLESAYKTEEKSKKKPEKKATDEQKLQALESITNKPFKGLGEIINTIRQASK